MINEKIKAKMKLIEQYQISDNGYHPFLIRDGWQVAQLNYMPEQEIGNIEKLDIHHLTDEVFILLKGVAVLIGAKINGDEVDFEVELLKPNITYNVPVDTWHNIAMRKDCEIIIVEKSNTHEGDFKFFQLSQEKKKEMETLVRNAFDQH
jgi:mannose-6-phosphate isomerase-like protein (cupin superfamily)